MLNSISNQKSANQIMPSFDIVSEVDKQEIDNALNQARKELATRFDFKGSAAEIIHEKDKITLTAEGCQSLARVAGDCNRQISQAQR
jgi:uncharacterized protein YajQ (UPF0234 family)